MPIQTQALLSRLNPMSAIDVSGLAAPGSASMARQNLQLMREKFEEEKRYHKEQAELQRLGEAGEMRRAEMTAANQRRQAEAAAAEKRRAEAAAAYNDFHKARLNNDWAGMTAAGDRLREFGGLAEQGTPDAQGRPNWRVGMDAADYNQRAAQHDAVEQEMQTVAPEGSVWLPPDVAQQRTLSRLNALGLSGVPDEGRVNMGEQMDQRRAQMGPVLESLRQSLPSGAYRDSAEHSDEAALRMGLSQEETAKQAQSFRKDSGAVIKGELDAERDFEKAELTAERAYDKEMREAKRDEDKQAVAAAKDGRANAAKQWKDEGLHKLGEADKAADQIVDMLSNGQHLDDSQIAHLFVKLKGSIGPQSDKEIDAVFGTSDMSTPELVVERIRNFFAGGVGDPIKQSLISIVENSLQMNDERALAFLDSVQNTLDSPETTEEAKRGWRQFRDSVDQRYRDAWDEDRKAQGLPTFDEGKKERAPQRESGMRATPALHEGIAADADFMDTLSGAFEDLGVAAEEIVPKLLPLINYESGGDPHAANKKSSAKGLIQFIDEVAQGYGFKDSAEFAALSAAEQAPYIAQYLVDRGIDAASTIGDIYVAIAAPGLVDSEDDAVAYRKDAPTERERDAYTKNPDWDLDKDGKIKRGELAELGERKGKGGRAKAQERQTKTEAKGNAKAAKKPGKNDAELDQLLE